MSESGLPPGGDGAEELEQGGELPPDQRAQDGGAPADSGADEAEAAFERRHGSSRRQDRRWNSLLAERAQLRRENDELKRIVQAATKVAGDARAQSLDSEIAEAKAAYQAAFNEGNAQAASDATERLAELKAQKLALQSAPPVVPQSQGAVSAEAQEWIDRNPRFRTDPAFNEAAMAGHRAALAAGMKVDSSEYFEMIESVVERRLGKGSVNRMAVEDDAAGSAEDGMEQEVQSRTPPARPSGPAPAGRAARPAVPGTGRPVTTVPAAYRARVEEFAKLAGMSVLDYWRAAQEEVKAGRASLDHFRS